MIVIDDILISEEITKRHFVCDLSACKGACCIEGDAGAPLDEDELPILDEIWSEVAPYLSAKSRKYIEKHGKYVKDWEDAWVTPLVDGDGPCAFVIQEKGVNMCGIEKAYLDGKIKWKKPVSCHLYPIRVREMKKVDTVALNYHKWDICKAACENGKALQVPIYKFVKEGLIRRFGRGFYKELDAVVTAMEEAKKEKKGK